MKARSTITFLSQVNRRAKSSNKCSTNLRFFKQFYSIILSSEIIFNFHVNFKNCWSNGQKKTPPLRLTYPFSRLTASWTLQIPLMCVLCPYNHRTARKCTNLRPRNIDLMRNFPLKPHVLLSSGKFRSSTSAPFLGMHNCILRAVRVPVGTMGSRGPSGDLARRMGWNYGAFNNYRNHAK
jgi:hypothetical protein